MHHDRLDTLGHTGTDTDAAWKDAVAAGWSESEPESELDVTAATLARDA